MDVPELLGAAPETLRLGAHDGGSVLARDLVALHGGEGPEAPLARLGGGRASVHRAAALAAGAPPDATLGPVYRMDPGGGLVVPTGRALVRFAAGERVELRAPELADAGYELDQPLSFAPHAGWVRARAGGIPGALAGLERLRRVGGVEHVEPETLMERGARLDA